MRKHTPIFVQMIQLPIQEQALRKHAQTRANTAQTYANTTQTMRKHCANTAQTLRKRCTNPVQTLRKHCANTAQICTSIISAQTMRKDTCIRANTAQTSSKHCSNYAQTLHKHCANICLNCANNAQTLRKHCANTVKTPGEPGKHAQYAQTCVNLRKHQKGLQNVVLICIHSWDNCVRCSDCYAHFSHYRNSISPFPASAAPSSQDPKSRHVNHHSHAQPSRDDDQLPTPSYTPTTNPCRFQQGKRSPGRCGQGAVAKKTSTGIPAS
jgi:hypothetical protein